MDAAPPDLSPNRVPFRKFSPMSSKTLLLASTSPYRRALLARLRLPFQVMAPHVSEELLPGEAPAARARRLAIAKACALGKEAPLVIGADQVAALGECILDKPGTLERAVEQLLTLSGREACFYTALCLYNGTSRSLQADCVPTWVRFRRLTEKVVRTYLAAEPALDCAGAFKSEGLGISLVERVSTSDPTALIGLPLLRLSAMLRTQGWEIPPLATPSPERATPPA